MTFCSCEVGKPKIMSSTAGEPAAAFRHEAATPPTGNQRSGSSSSSHQSRRRSARPPSAGRPPASTSPRRRRPAPHRAQPRRCRCSASRRVDAISAGGRRRRSSPSSHGDGQGARVDPQDACTALAMVLDHAGVTPNPARDRVASGCRARSPRSRTRRAPSTSRPSTGCSRPSTGSRCSSSTGRAPASRRSTGRSSATTTSRAAASACARRRRRRGRRSGSSCTRRSPTRSRRRSGRARIATPSARLFAGSGADALRTSIAKACRAAGDPALVSPHDLRHRRISLLHLRGVPWARIGEFVGQRNLAVTANTYTHVLVDEAELDYRSLLA